MDRRTTDADLRDWLMEVSGRRFRVVRPLKHGGGIDTVLARDATSGREVVVKILSGEVLSAPRRAHLVHEVAALRDSAPAVMLLGADRTAGPLGLVREFVSGVTLEERLRSSRLPLAEVLALGARVCSLLERTHAAGVIHGDIKPSNIVLADAPAGAVALVDFGVGRPAALDTPVSEALYLAPEQSGLIESPVDARADLYAAGVVLHQCVTGRPPFTGESLGEVLRQHLITPPPRLTAAVPGTPRALEEIIERLLRKDPRDRYQTAAGARVDLEALAAALEGGTAQPDIIIASRDRRTALSEPAFVGHAEPLNALEQVLAAASRGQGGLVLVEGESGMGKTWLLDELGKRALSRGAMVLHGRGLDQIARRPFQLLSGMAHELVASLANLPERRAELAERLDRAGMTGAARAALPELGAILKPGPTEPLGLEAHGEARSFAALGALLDALGSVAHPAVVLFDDGQWADGFTLELLARWQADSSAADTRHTFIALAFRSEEVPEGHPLRGIQAAAGVVLGPFDEHEVRQEIASMAGQLPAPAIEAVVAHCGGSPFLVSALVRGLAEAGAVVPGPGGWRLDHEALDALQASSEIDDILALRLARLQGMTRRLLRTGAVLGRTFATDLVAALAEIELGEAVALLNSCRGGLVWSGAGGATFTFVHDRVREAVLAEIAPPERRRLHRRTAERLRATDPDRVFEVAYHFDAAGDAEAALPFAVAAAERARARFALELAEQHYRIALRGAGLADRAVRFRIASGLAEMLTLRGTYDEATRQYAAALDLAGSARERAEVEERWAQLELKRGDLAAACRHGEAALRRIGRWVPRSPWTCSAAALWELGVQVLHTNLPGLFLGRRQVEDPVELFALRLYHGMNGPYFFSKGSTWAGWAHLRHLNQAERYPPSIELGRAYASHATIVSGFPRLFERGLRLTRAGAELCARLGDVWGEAEAWTFHSMMLHFMGRHAESIDVGRMAAALFDRAGDRWLANSGLLYAAYSLFRMGSLEASVEMARQVYQRGSRIGDVHALAWSLDAWSRATDGRVPRELVETERARSREHIQTSVAVSLAEGVLLLGEDRPREAEALFEDVVGRVRSEIGHFHDLSTPVAVYLVTAIRRQIEQVSPWNQRRRAELLRKARRASRFSVRLSRRFRNNLPHALREAAYLAALVGHPHRARAHIDESIAVATELGERDELAQSRLARATIGSELGWAGAAAELEQAERDLRATRGALAEPAIERGAARASGAGPRAASGEVTLSLIDRYSSLLEAGHRIATALSPDAIHAVLRESVLTLLRAERCVLLSAEPPQQGERVPVHGDAGIRVSEPLVRRAIEEGGPVTPLESSESQSGTARSTLCVPILVRGRPEVCVYATHREVTGLFNQEALQIARFLATLAGAALENAEGFAHIQAFSRTLETRVEERTAQLGRANRELERNLDRLRQTQDELIQAGKMAAIGTLVAGLSHELNNPLSVILGFSQTLLKHSDLPETHPHLAALRGIERNAERCGALVRALLDFSRSRPAERVSISPPMLVKEVMELVKAEARGREVELRVEVAAGDLAPVDIAKQEIEAALLNLLSNALHATGRGGTATVMVKPEERAGRPGVEIAVRDTGSGIPEGDLARVFDPFFTTKPVGQGTGLGLPLARRSIEAEGGTIAIESDVGKGTLVRVWLPAQGTALRDAPGQSTIDTQWPS